MKKKLRLLAAFACNLAILALEARTILPLWDWGTLPFYTQDSNLFAAAACALAAVLQLRSLLNGKAFPRWARLLKYMAACCLTLTMLVVTLVLAPVYLGADGYRQLLLEEPALSLHLLCPLLTLASFLLFETEPALPRRAVALAVLPTLVYGAALGCLNGWACRRPLSLPAGARAAAACVRALGTRDFRRRGADRMADSPLRRPEKFLASRQELTENPSIFPRDRVILFVG